MTQVTLTHPEDTTWLRVGAAAAYVGLAPSTLAKLRVRGSGPVYSKAGSRIVLYRISDLDYWLDGQRRTSTSDAGSRDE
jgi:hypothetical protein